jgi:hypothetical protein
VIIAKYLVYYTKAVPNKLQNFITSDRHVILLKDGLSNINGYMCPRLSLQVISINSRVDGQRIISLNSLLDSLIKTGQLEHYAKT